MVLSIIPTRRLQSVQAQLHFALSQEAGKAVVMIRKSAPFTLHATEVSRLISAHMLHVYNVRGRHLNAEGMHLLMTMVAAMMGLDVALYLLGTR